MAAIEKVLQELPAIAEMLYQMYKDETDKESISVRYDRYLAVNDAIELLKSMNEWQQPRAVKNVHYFADLALGDCPSCGGYINKGACPNFCGWCGDRIDWSKAGEQ